MEMITRRPSSSVYPLLFLACVALLIGACATSPAVDFYSGVHGGASLDEVKKIVAEGHPNQASKDYWLCMAADAQRADVVTYMLAAGADINACWQGDDRPVPRSWATPLHRAAASNAVGIIKVLLRHGADPERRNADGETPLQLAMSLDKPQAARVLRQERDARLAWNAASKDGSMAALTRYLEQYPDSHDAAAARHLLAEKQDLEAQRRRMLAQQEASLPAAMRRDKYMVSLSRHLKQKNYVAALPLFEKLEKLPIAQDPSLEFFYGEALLRAGQPAKALIRLYRYVQSQGTNATHYTRALALINEAEAQQ